MGRFGGAGGMVEKITRLTKLARRKAVKDEKIANSGPRTPVSPSTLAVGGKKLNTEGAVNTSWLISAAPMAEPPTLSESNTPSLVALKARRRLVMNSTGSRSLP